MSSCDKRLTSIHRRINKQLMIDVEGDGTYVMCVHGCGRVLTYATVEQDRIVPGGGYGRDNIQPSCRPCNIARGDNPNWTLPTEERAACLSSQALSALNTSLSAEGLEFLSDSLSLAMSH